MVPAQEIIDLLERAKHEHYIDRSEGIFDCSARSYGKPDDDSKCDCGAAEINAELDAMIGRLREQHGIPGPEPSPIIVPDSETVARLV